MLNAPQSFEPELAALKGIAVVREINDKSEISFSLAFVTRQAEVDTLSRAIVPRTRGDALVWFAYPKGTSKKYQCEFNRDTGWAVLQELGFRGIRIVSIDEDWSALRFRRVEFIKSKKTS